MPSHRHYRYALFTSAYSAVAESCFGAISGLRLDGTSALRQTSKQEGELLLSYRRHIDVRKLAQAFGFALP